MFSKLKDFCLNHRITIRNTLIKLAGLSLITFLFPAPYNPVYLFKRVFVQPTAICSDGVYSFSASKWDCNNHGGVRN